MPWRDRQKFELALGFFLVLGVLARSVRYLLGFPLWKDEAFLAANYIDAGFLDLAGPLYPHQVAPIFYLFGQLALTKAFGFNEYTLRAVSFASGIGSLFLFRFVASRVLRGMGLLIAVAIFSVGYPLIRFSGEAKVYALDVLVALALMALVVRWWDDLDQTRWLWALAALAPVAVALSYPSLMVLGGLGVVIAVVSWTARQHRAWLPWAVFDLSTLGGFATVYLLVTRQQSAGELEWMRLPWKDSFPPLDSVVDFARWFVEIHIGDMLSYPVARGDTSGTVMFVCCLAGAWAFLQARRYLLLLFCCAPPAMNLVAAAFELYPYGGHVRVALYLAPVFCLLGGLGCAAIARWARRDRPSFARPGLAAAVVLALLGFISIGRDLIRPYKQHSDALTREFARSFWEEAQADGEVVCLDTDLGMTFSDETTPQYINENGVEALLNISSLFTYRCNVRIYSARDAAGEDPRWDAASPDRPVRFVRFKAGEITYDEEAVRHWVAELNERCSSVAEERHTFPIDDGKEGEVRPVDAIEVWTCVPKGPALRQAAGAAAEDAEAGAVGMVELHRAQ